jgi:hypothetical protein
MTTQRKSDIAGWVAVMIAILGAAVTCGILMQKVNAQEDTNRTLFKKLDEAQKATEIVKDKAEIDHDNIIQIREQVNEIYLILHPTDIRPQNPVVVKP